MFLSSFNSETVQDVQRERGSYLFEPLQTPIKRETLFFKEHPIFLESMESNYDGRETRRQRLEVFKGSPIVLSFRDFGRLYSGGCGEEAKKAGPLEKTAWCFWAVETVQTKEEHKAAARPRLGGAPSILYYLKAPLLLSSSIFFLSSVPQRARSRSFTLS